MVPFIVVIPARYSSSRLPGKPLLDIAGKPMVQRVYEQAQKSRATKVIVATDDERISQCVKAFGGDVCMTSPDHVSGTDRLEEVATSLGLENDAYIVNVQGDEPLISPAVIDQVAHNLMKSGVSMSTLSEPLASLEEAFNPNVVKVVTDINGIALYFSRAPVPWVRESYGSQEANGVVSSLAQRHIGIYGYQVKLLHQYVQWGPCELEVTECLEQLRAMWHGIRIHVEEAVEAVAPGVDTEDDLQNIRRLIQAKGL